MTAPFYNKKAIKPFISLLMILSSLFVIAFFKITLRSFSYVLQEASLAFDKAQDEYYSNIKIYSKMTQTKRLESLAKTRPFKHKKKGQIIQVINGTAIVLD